MHDIPRARAGAKKNAPVFRRGHEDLVRHSGWGCTKESPNQGNTDWLIFDSFHKLIRAQDVLTLAYNTLPQQCSTDSRTERTDKRDCMRVAHLYRIPDGQFRGDPDRTMMRYDY